MSNSEMQPIKLLAARFPKQSSAVGFLTVLEKRGLASESAPGEIPALLFLCAGCGNSEGHVAPVYAKHSVAFLF